MSDSGKLHSRGERILSLSLSVCPCAGGVNEYKEWYKYMRWIENKKSRHARLVVANVTPAGKEL